MKLSKLTRVRPGGRPWGLARLLGVIQGGVSLLQPMGTAFAAFLAVPAQAAVDMAMKIAEAFAAAGLFQLTPEQRAVLSAQVDDNAILLAPEVATALGRASQVEKAVGEKGADLQARLEQEEELIGIDKGVTQTQGLVGDARLALQAWLFEAQGRLVDSLFVEFTQAQTAAERVQIAGDAGPALDPLEKQLTALRATKVQGTRATAQQEAELERLDNDILLLRTMRALNNKEPVDEALLQRMAKYYAERVPAGRTASSGPLTDPSTGTTGAKGKGGKKGTGTTGKKKKPTPPSGLG